MRAYDEGQGPPIVMVHPGLSDGRRCGKVAAILSGRYRVLRLDRRQYRLDRGAPVQVEQEVEDVLALIRSVGKPVVLYGHSSGGVVALEALVASPSSFAGAVIFEPSAVIGPPLSGEGGEVLQRARAAMASGKPGKALTIFMRDTVGLPDWQAWLGGAITALIPHYRRLVPRQLDDLEAMDRLGVRLDAYAAIEVPTVLLGGERSPANLAERLDAVQRVMPRAERVVLSGCDHGADLKKPAEVARVIRELAEKVIVD
ncbi:alpha/beta fold hydrolase [Streptosporangium sp. CA-135522]|uniref:alpha/beta fold hydrolase n=1 Tax=Streptosporangium sp. CA-135522 TaxID=3240072 RepID=UPI003D8DEFC1